METQELEITKLVHGGQGLAISSDGRKCFVWNALPGEKIRARIIRSKKDYLEAIAEEIIVSSPNRLEPIEPEIFLATSPWQVLKFEYENTQKKLILQETFERQGIALEYFDFTFDNKEYRYRNKMEYSFYGDEQGLHLALHKRGSRQKIIVVGSKLAIPEVDLAAKQVLRSLAESNVLASQLKSLIIRCSQSGEAIGALFVKDSQFNIGFSIYKPLVGLEIYYSSPKSPASVPTNLLKTYGRETISDKILGKSFSYGARSFFQGNLPIYEVAIKDIKLNISTNESVVDMFSGVGSIGLSLESEKLRLVEIEEQSYKMAEFNSAGRAEVIHSGVDQALNLIEAGSTIIFDPPRAGLSSKVIERVLKYLPPKIIYLSCNPSTQARDVAALTDKYRIGFFKGYNFFPKTPHIESLVVLHRN